MGDRISMTTAPGSNALAVKRTGPSSNVRKIANTKNRKNVSNVQRNRPPTFVSKIWSMINNPANHDYIQWMPDGQSFQVIAREQFETKVLPKYFKTKNFSSFVRQLNMYGWHKVQDISSGSMENPEEKWQFRSPNFIRGREDLLDNIQRNKGSKESDDEDEVDLGRVLEELEHIRENQLSIGQDLLTIRQDNQMLWNEHLQSQEKYQKQAETLDRIVRFLASLYGSQAKLLTDSHSSSANGRNQLLLMPNPDNSPLQDGSSMNDNDNNGIYENGQVNNDDLAFPISDSKRITSLSSGGSPRETVSAVDVPSVDGSANTTDNSMALALSRKNRQFNARDISKTLFPELNNYDNDAKSLSPLSKQLTLGERIDDNSNKLNNLTRDIDSQEMSIQQFQDLIQKMVPGYDRDGAEAVPFSTTSPGAFDSNNGENLFDMNDFLVDPASADINTTDLGNVANGGHNTQKVDEQGESTQRDGATRTNKKRKVSKR